MIELLTEAIKSAALESGKSGLNSALTGDWRKTIGELVAKNSVSEGGKINDSLQFSMIQPGKGINILRDGNLQEIIPVPGSEAAVRTFFAKGGPAEQILASPSTANERIFAVNQNFHAMPNHEITASKEVLSANGAKVETILPKPEAKQPLPVEQKSQIQLETGWPDEIITPLTTYEEHEIYKNANLSYGEIEGKPCLVKDDIDWKQKDSMGRTNEERAGSGLSPISKNGETIELHHVGQKNDSPLAELTTNEHRGTGNDLVLHDKTKESEIDRNTFSKEREDHWKERAKISVEDV